ncbi:hypothetical protein SEA_YEEZY_41 [Gordonia phage Yeezy]|uniref:DUF7323 domain-containing protein n=1 Tax=Gordonia phage Yeezy TaxID=1821565 RepID=A0A142K9K3_9CAUD|nr:hypothetical protein SEA_YEEZY_41 [Gordonia phage Yeezy]AMS02786.1 hypothetical protein SEA_YEEZY_41 [Gordonia phage Yeezy]
MNTATWRPSQFVAYPVVGIEGYFGDRADIVVDVHGLGPAITTASLDEIEVATTLGDLTPQLTDHSDVRRCGCGERATGAQASAAGDAAEATSPPAGRP